MKYYILEGFDSSVIKQELYGGDYKRSDKSKDTQKTRTNEPVVIVKNTIKGKADALAKKIPPAPVQQVK